MNQTYQLSGKAGNLWLTGLLAGPPLAIVLSIVYALINVYNPFVYLTILVYFGFLFGIVMIQKLIIRISKCRNQQQAFLFGLFIGLFTLYASWCTFLYVMLPYVFEISVSLKELLTDPGYVWQLMTLVGESGWFSFSGSNVNGTFLWIIWIIEAVGIIVAAMVGAYSVLHEEVFCEDCNRWAEDVKFDLRLSMEDHQKADDAVKNNILGLLELKAISGNETPHLRVNLNHCSNCDDFSTIDVDLIKLERDKKGKLEEKSDDLSPVILLSKEDYLRFQVKKEQFLKAPFAQEAAEIASEPAPSGGGGGAEEEEK